jgi:hypothetical protein
LHLSPNVFDPLGSEPVNNSTNHQTQFSITESINQASNQFINQEMNKSLSLSHPSPPLSKTSILLPSKSKQQSLASTIHPSVDVVSAISNNFNPHQKAENFLLSLCSQGSFPPMLSKQITPRNCSISSKLSSKSRHNLSQRNTIISVQPSKLPTTKLSTPRAAKQVEPLSFKTILIRPNTNGKPFNTPQRRNLQNDTIQSQTLKSTTITKTTKTSVLTTTAPFISPKTDSWTTLKDNTSISTFTQSIPSTNLTKNNEAIQQNYKQLKIINATEESIITKSNKIYTETSLPAIKEQSIISTTIKAQKDKIKTAVTNFIKKNKISPDVSIQERQTHLSSMTPKLERLTQKLKQLSLFHKSLVSRVQTKLYKNMHSC